MYGAIGRYCLEKKDDLDEFIGTSLYSVGLILCLTIPIFIIFNKKIIILMKLPNALFIYIIFYCLLGIIFSIYGQILINKRISKEYALISILKGYIGFGISVLFIYFMKENRYLGRIWAGLLINFFFSIYFILRISKFSRLVFRTEHFKYILNYAIPLIPYGLSGIILAQFDRIMINNIIDTSSAGLYSLGYNIGMLLLLVNGATLSALGPDFVKFLDKKEYSRVDNLLEKVFSIGLVVALGLILFAKEIVIILADVKFHEGLKVVPIVVIGYVFYEMYYMYGMYPGYQKKTVFTSIAVIFAGILNIILNAMYIPKYGYIAGAYTTVVSYFIMFMLAWIIAKFILKQRVSPLWIFWKPTIIMFCFIAFTYFLNTLGLSVILFILIKLMLLVLFIFIVFYKEIISALHYSK